MAIWCRLTFDMVQMNKYTNKIYRRMSAIQTSYDSFASHTNRHRMLISLLFIISLCVVRQKRDAPWDQCHIVEHMKHSTSALKCTIRAWHLHCTNWICSSIAIDCIDALHHNHHHHVICYSRYGFSRQWLCFLSVWIRHICYCALWHWFLCSNWITRT